MIFFLSLPFFFKIFWYTPNNAIDARLTKSVQLIESFTTHWRNPKLYLLGHQIKYLSLLSLNLCLKNLFIFNQKSQKQNVLLHWPTLQDSLKFVAWPLYFLWFNFYWRLIFGDSFHQRTLINFFICLLCYLFDLLRLVDSLLILYHHLLKIYILSNTKRLLKTLIKALLKFYIKDKTFQ